MSDLPVLKVHKYPNRRLYDQTHSRHMTVEELYEAVVAGHTVVVTDSKTERDITNAVLLAALIERDPSKLAALPPEMVHLMIRATEGVLQSFMAQWLALVMRAASPGVAWPGIPTSAVGGWWPGGAAAAQARSPAQAEQPEAGSTSDDADLAARVERLSRELDALRDAARRRGN